MPERLSPALPASHPARDRARSPASPYDEVATAPCRNEARRAYGVAVVSLGGPTTAIQ